MDNALPLAENNEALPLADEGATPQPAETQTEAPPANPQTWKLKVDREEVEVEHEKVIEYAQKGMAFDRLKEQRDKLQSELERSKQATDIIDEIADQTGKTRDEIIEQIRKQRLAAKAKAENKPVGQLEAEERAQKAEKRADSAEEREATKERHAREMQEFKDAYPDVDVGALSKDILDDWIQNNTPLTKAYRVAKAMEYEKSNTELKTELETLSERIKQMEQQQKAQEINAENAATAPGPLGSGEPGDKPLTWEDVDKMTPAERAKNHERIAKDVYGWRE